MTAAAAPTLVAVAPVPLGASVLAGTAGADVLALPVATGNSGPDLGIGAAEAAARYGVDLAAVCGQSSFTGRAGSVLTVTSAGARGDGGADLPQRLLLVGVGDRTPRDLRRAGAGLARAVRDAHRVATTAAAGVDAEGVRALAEGVVLASSTPPRTGLTPAPPPPVGTAVLLEVPPADADALTAASRAAAATWWARGLTATPADVATPAHVAERAVALAQDRPRMDVEVVDAAGLLSRGMGGVLAVGAGSAQAPCLVIARYTPDAAPSGSSAPSAPGAPAAPPPPSAHVVLAGKGVTFDTGGLSVKPRESMVAMKTDMAGAAVVLAVVAALAEDGACRHRVTALAPLAENALGGGSYRPGDVVTTHGGRTVEVANTDAEGRMLLADVLALADAELEPDVVIDVATLTGAATQGLGRRHAALYTGDDELAAALTAAGLATGERVWRMPLVEDYLPSLDSDVADLRHVPLESPGAGSVTAALFLREFTGGRRWAHLDIAGPARADEDEDEVNAGATGFGARLLLRWLEGW